ncbi:GNAT family N-acetyltransferase [Nocardia sp. NBC_00511]|uniref:GNAT family N-acetyltransferase n=1 Tax=Nocardia sp. NBC_00511 TaxID=2903591 RepID=UPI0030E4B00C
MPDLIAPSTHLHTAWLEAHTEWGPGLHEDGFGLLTTDEVHSPTGFAAWVARLADKTDRGTRHRWIVQGDRVLGGIALRHGSGESVLRLGHIGFGIRPSARRQGIGTWALGEMLSEAKDLDMNRVLLVCAADNVASASTIERNGGILEAIQDTEHGPARRYWISLGGNLTVESTTT